MWSWFFLGKEARYEILVAHCPPYHTAIDRLHARVGTSL